MVSFDHYIAALEQRVTNGGFIYRAGVAVAFDYKKGYKEYYLPPKKPGVVEVPEMAFLAVRGHGDPNEEGGAYKDALEMLYGVAYTIKMSKKGDHRIEGYFDFVVPPLEGFWWQDGVLGVDYARKEDFNWISAIRVPDFVTRSEFEWAVEEATAKKKRDFSQVELLTIEEGLCVQCLHVGPYDDEPATVEAMRAFAEESGYVEDFSDERMHHEIYLNDARRTAPEKLKTVIRHPVRRA
ncbi:hypothetical protein HMPREF9452_00843 [Collinsella tanakaei YIT 12063]|uniref:GyrI-like small molecule binding domain-containing protein n=1 Tax=Collinsella tanakaei YIT 12063 TaxID=742742 RepID=G1WHN0_9ACTN|nr:GyrI-like domain-containing protein [Collinsella tanakaei]EGX71455.1 hypothetical protein HMPREF9452_00843 [Collinsella tanakaei YIT 12063]